MKPRYRLPIAILSAALAAFPGCGGSSSGTPPPVIAVQITSTVPATLTTKAILSLSAFVQNTPSSTQVSWSVTCGSPNACGIFSSATSSNGTSTTYTAPAAVPTGQTVRIIATSVADPTKSASATLTISAAVTNPIVVTLDLMLTSTLPAGHSATFLATVQNDTSANPQVRWSASCSNIDCGSFQPATSGSGLLTTYTAPTTAPADKTVTITATSATDPSKAASGSISVYPDAPNPSLPDGTYVYQLAFSNDGDAWSEAGVFTASGGVILTGESDSGYYNSSTTIGSLSANRITGGTYTTTADGNIQLNLQIWNSQLIESQSETLLSTPAPNGTSFLAGVPIPPGVLFSSGTLNRQSTQAAPSAGYAFTLNTTGQFLTSDAGILNIDSPGQISGVGSTLDQYLQANSADLNYTTVTGSVTAPDFYGRVLFNVLGQHGIYADNDVMAGYLIDSTRIAVAGFGGSSGVALAQGTSTGNFPTTSLAGSTYAFWAGANPLVAGTFTANSDGTLTGALDWVGPTSAATPNPLPFTGTYSVEPNGRVTLSNLQGAGFNFTFHMYLDAAGNGLLLSDDMTNASIVGRVFLQQSAAFSSASLNGTYNLSTSQVPYLAAGGPALGSITATTNGNTVTFTGYADETYFQGSNSGKTNIPISGSFTAAPNGIFQGSITGLDVASTTTAHPFTLYLVDSTQGFAIQSDNQQATILFLQRQ